MPVRRRKFLRRKRFRRRMARPSTKRIMRIAKRTIYRTTETKEHYSTTINAAPTNYYAVTGYRTWAYPLNGGAFDVAGSSYPSGPAQGTTQTTRIGNKIWAKGCKFTFTMNITAVGNVARWWVPVRIQLLYFNDGWNSNTNITGSETIQAELGVLTTVSRVDPKNAITIFSKEVILQIPGYPTAQNIYPIGTGHRSLIYKDLWCPFKYKKTFMYAHNSDTYPNNCSYVLTFTYPYTAVTDTVQLGINAQHSMFFKDI